MNQNKIVMKLVKEAVLLTQLAEVLTSMAAASAALGTTRKRRDLAGMLSGSTGPSSSGYIRGCPPLLPQTGPNRQPSHKQQGSGHTKTVVMRAISNTPSDPVFESLLQYLELGASARKTLRRGPLPSFSTASCITSIALAAEDALSNLM